MSPEPLPRVPHSTDDLEAAELELQRAMLHADVVALEALLDDEAQFVGPGEALFVKDDILDAYRSGRLRVRAFEVERSRVRVIDELGLTDVLATASGTHEGAPFQTRLRYQRTWRLADAWAVVSAHAAPVKATRR